MHYIRTLLFLTLVIALSTQAEAAKKAAKAKIPNDQQKLIDLLRGNARPAEKALACKRLAIIGDGEAVPALAALLPARSLPPGHGLPWRPSRTPRPTTPCGRHPAS